MCRGRGEAPVCAAPLLLVSRAVLAPADSSGKIAKAHAALHRYLRSLLVSLNGQAQWKIAHSAWRQSRRRTGAPTQGALWRRDGRRQSSADDSYNASIIPEKCYATLQRALSRLWPLATAWQQLVAAHSNSGALVRPPLLASCPAQTVLIHCCWFGCRVVLVVAVRTPAGTRLMQDPA